MFFGFYCRRIDEKGRIFIPAEFREKLDEEVIVMQDFNRCFLFVFPPDYLEKMCQKVKKEFNDFFDSFLRKLSSVSSKQKIDSQNRIKIPLKLRKYANLERKVVVSGSIDYLEIWSEEAWQKNLKDKNLETEFSKKERG